MREGRITHNLSKTSTKIAYSAIPDAPGMFFRLSAVLGEVSFSLKLCLDSRLLLDLFRVRAAFNSVVSTRDPAEPTLRKTKGIRQAGHNCDDS